MPVIALVGGVGVGKTFWGNKLVKKIQNSIFLEEQVTENLFLNEFYADMKKWGFHSRISMLSMVLDSTKDAYNSENIVILDRCVNELIVFAQKEYDESNMSDKEFLLYKQLYNAITHVLPSPDVYLYFTCSPDICYTRIMKRNRECERNITKEFCQDVICRYDSWRKTLLHNKVIDINTDTAVDLNLIKEKIRLCGIRV